MRHARDEIIEGAARALYVNWYAQQADEGRRGFRRADSGADWMDVAPPTSRAALRFARKFIAAVEATNDADIVRLFGVALTAVLNPDNHNTRDEADATPDRFGHYLAMSAMGEGVSWNDDYPEAGILAPSVAFYGERGEIDDRFVSVCA